MKKLMGFILVLLFLLIIFLNKDLEGLTQPDKEEWNKTIETMKTNDKWEDFKVGALILMMAMQNEQLKELMKNDALKEKTLGESNTILFEDVKEKERKFTDKEYKLINGLFNNNPTFVNEPLKNLLGYLTTKVDTFNRIKDEYKADQATTMKELDDKIKEE